jgi:hypothetical protein
LEQGLHAMLFYGSESSGIIKGRFCLWELSKRQPNGAYLSPQLKLDAEILRRARSGAVHGESAKHSRAQQLGATAEHPILIHKTRFFFSDARNRA